MISDGTVKTFCVRSALDVNQVLRQSSTNSVVGREPCQNSVCFWSPRRLSNLIYLYIFYYMPMEELPGAKCNLVVWDQKCNNLAFYKNNRCTNATLDLYHKILLAVIKTLVNQKHLIENQRVYWNKVHFLMSVRWNETTNL